MYHRHQAYDLDKTKDAERLPELFDWLLDWEKNKRIYMTQREYMRRGVAVFNGANNTSFFMEEALERFEEWREDNEDKLD